MSRKPPFFIVGAQRSGTTLLFQIFNNHPELYVVNEFWDLYPFVIGENRDLAELERLLRRHLKLERSYLDGDSPPPDDPFDHVDLAFETRLREVGKRRWGIKHPRLTHYLEPFRERYPEARFVFIVRDARASVSSNVRQRFNVANVFYGARLWQEQVALQRQFSRRHPENSHWLRFEDLLADPAKEIAEICRFLDETYHDSLLEFYRRRPETSIHSGNVNITRPLQADVKERWRKELSPRQIAVIDRVAGKELVEHGYPVSSQGGSLGWPRRAGYAVHQFVLTNYWWQRRSHWGGLRRRLGLARGERD